MVGDDVDTSVALTEGDGLGRPLALNPHAGVDDWFADTDAKRETVGDAAFVTDGELDGTTCDA